MAEGSRIRVYADVREEASGVPEFLKGLGLNVIVTRLQVGDYIVSRNVVVERKTSSDFVASLFDGRLFNQASRLTEAYGEAFMVVEGEALGGSRLKGRERAFLSAIASLSLEYGVKLVYTGTPFESALFIESLARRAQAGERRGIIIHKKPRISSDREWQLYIVQSFPGIGPKLAHRILEKFGSIESFINSSYSELSSILGEVRAERIKRLVREPFKRPASRRRRGLDKFYGEA